MTNYLFSIQWWLIISLRSEIHSFLAGILKVDCLPGKNFEVLPHLFIPPFPYLCTVGWLVKKKTKLCQETAYKKVPDWLQTIS